MFFVINKDKVLTYTVAVITIVILLAFAYINVERGTIIETGARTTRELSVDSAEK